MTQLNIPELKKQIASRPNLNSCDFKSGDKLFLSFFNSKETLLRFHYNRTKMIHRKQNANNMSDLFTKRDDLFQVDCEEVSLTS